MPGDSGFAEILYLPTHSACMQVSLEAGRMAQGPSKEVNRDGPETLVRECTDLGLKQLHCQPLLLVIDNQLCFVEHKVPAPLPLHLCFHASSHKVRQVHIHPGFAAVDKEQHVFIPHDGCLVLWGRQAAQHALD